MGYDKYGYYTDKGRFERINLDQALKNMLTVNYIYRIITEEELERLLPYLVPVTKKYLKENGIEDMSENQDNYYILVEQKKAQEKIERLLQNSRFTEWFYSYILKYADSKDATFEGYDLTEEAIIVLTSAGYTSPEKVYENPDQLLKQLDRICFGKQYLMREIINQLKLENIIEEDTVTNKQFTFSTAKMVPKGDSNGSIIDVDDQTGISLARLVQGKISLDEAGSIKAPALFAIDNRGNIYTRSEYSKQRVKIVVEKRTQYEEVEKHITKMNQEKEKLSENISEDVDVILIIDVIYILVTLPLIVTLMAFLKTFGVILAIAIELIGLIALDKDVLQRIAKIRKLNRGIKEAEELIEGMKYIPQFDTRYIADYVENVYNSNPEIGDIEEAVKLLNPETGRLLMEGKINEEAKLLNAPQKPEIVEPEQPGNNTTDEQEPNELIDESIPELIGRLEQLQSEIIAMNSGEMMNENNGTSHQKTLKI